MDEVFNAVIALGILLAVMGMIVWGMINGDPPENQRNSPSQDELFRAKRRNPHEPHQPPE
jgi:hypothetical protein